MKIVIAPDSFKGSLSAIEASQAIANGLRRVLPDADLILLPIADGGEGSLDTLCAAANGSPIAQAVADPLGNRIAANWGLLGDGKTAVVELAQAAGLSLIPKEKRDPKTADTFGVGELIRAAISTKSPTDRLIICLGGSATNDGGSGILRALGVRLLDGNGAELQPGGADLRRLHRLENADEIRHSLPNIEILIACDVDNLLTGTKGASAVFGAQKGASPEDIRLLDSSLAHYAEILARSGRNIAAIPGSGAAGGAAAALLWLFPNAVLRPGIEIVLDAVGFDSHIADADLIITGEGRLDSQTLGGKAIIGVAKRAAKYNVPVIAIVGSLLADAVSVNPLTGDRLANEWVIAAVQTVVPLPCSLEAALANAADWLADAAERAARMLILGSRLNF